MAVVTHGSFDEGPIVLALPPVYEYAGDEEVDPIFTAWDRSTGVTVSSAQITDFDAAVAAIASGVTPTGYVTDQELIDAIDVALDDASDGVDSKLVSYVPYSGATTNVALGSHSITANRLYTANETPTSSTELVSKAYADALAFNGAGGISPTVAHNDTTGKEGGGGGHWYHLSTADKTIIDPIVNQTAIATPSGLYVISKGAVASLAYIELGWVANVESNFDHYIVYYKKTGNSVWSEIVVSTNMVLIEGLVPNTQYDFGVAAVNKAGNITNMSTVFVTWMELDSAPPATVAGLVATGAIQAVLLRWTHNSDSDLVGYKIYRNTTNNSGTAVEIATYQGNAFMDNGPVVVGTIGLAVNTTYYYWLKAVDSSANVSTAFSTVASATTRNIIASDIVNIAASQVIIQGATTLSSWASPGVSTIDGDKITTGTVTLTKLNFTPALSNQIVATINASTEGIEIDAKLFKVSGTSIFAAGVPSTGLSRIYIYPNSTQGLRITDDVGNNVLIAEIGGTNVGDITIGNYAGGQGIWYDKSAGITHFAGKIEATSGSISGVLDFGTLAVTDSLKLSNIALSGNHIWENAYSGDNSSMWINMKGYAGGYTKYRNTYIGDGKGNILFGAVGGASPFMLNAGPLVLSVAYNGAISYLRLANITTANRAALTKAEGMMVYDTDLHRFCGVIETGGNLQWWTFGMSANVT